TRTCGSIYVLPLFFVTAKLARSIGIPGWVLWLAAAALQTFPPHTGWEALDDYGARCNVFFLTHLLAPQVFKLAPSVREHMEESAIALCGWFSFNAVIAFSKSPVAGYAKVADVPGLRIAVGLIGAMGGCDGGVALVAHELGRVFALRGPQLHRAVRLL